MGFSEELIERQKIRIWTQRLIEEYRQIQFSYSLKTRIPIIKIELLQSVWGNWDPVTRTIGISKRLIEQYPWETVIEILKHEIAHQIVTENYKENERHGILFKQACHRLGVAPWACRAETNSLPIEKTLSSTEFSSEEKRLLERAEKLLSLATSDNEHEAVLAMQKVQELYAKYNLNRIRDKKGSQWGYLLISLGKKRVERYQSVIASILSDHFFVEVIHTSTFDAKKCSESKALELLGTRENVVLAEYVFHFLEQQLKGLWTAYPKKTKLGVASRNSYFLGVLDGFREKLQSSEKSFADQVGDLEGHSLSLVVRHDEGLKDLVKSRYPKLNRLGGGHRLHDNEAFSAGRKEGRSLVIRKGISRSDGNQKKLLR